jgi:hypothetical protein
MIEISYIQVNLLVECQPDDYGYDRAALKGFNFMVSGSIGDFVRSLGPHLLYMPENKRLLIFGDKIFTDQKYK